MENNPISQENASILRTGINLKKGIVEASHDIIIGGNFTGTLISKAKVTIDSTASFNGTLQCVDFECFGKFDGKLIVSNLANFHSSSAVSGKINVGHFSVDDGATFTTDIKVIKGNKVAPAPIKK